MRNILVAFFLVFGGIAAFGQHPVSGYISLEQPGNGAHSVHLIKPGWEDKTSNSLIASADIQENGYFAFEEAAFTEQDEIYKLLVETDTSHRTPERSELSSRPFIISRKDSLFFPKGAPVFSSYSNSSRADKEWQKLQNHQAISGVDISTGTDGYLQETRDYTKDSLQILLVKLLSIKTLDEKKLLEKDIRENADYYLDLLEELQKSDLPPVSYAYLENRIQKTHHKLLERRYYTSLSLNGIAVFAVAGLLYLLFRMRKSKTQDPEPALSRQEENVKALILQGKTNKEIAEELFISISTVKTHITNIYSKLKVSSRKELRLKF